MEHSIRRSAAGGDAIAIGVARLLRGRHTLVVASGRNWRQAIARAEEALRRVILAIRTLGLRFALEKTEAMWLADRVGRWCPQQSVPLRIGEACIRVGRSMKYLGLTLDTYWRFTRHFRTLGPRLERQVFAFGRIMPNLGGPSRGCSATIRDGRSVHGALRRPYMGRRPGGTAALGENYWQEFMAARSSEPCELIARCHTPNCPLWLRPPHFISSRRWRRRFTPPSAISARRGTLQQSDAMWRGARPGSAWKPNGSSGFPLPEHREGRVVGALLPILGEWASRGYGRLTFRLTQVLCPA